MLETCSNENDENKRIDSANDATPESDSDQNNNNFYKILKNNLLRNKSKSFILGTFSQNTIKSSKNFDFFRNSFTYIDEYFEKDRKVPSIPFKVLDAPNLHDDFYLNVVDWSQNQNLAVGLGQSVYIWNYKSNEVKKLTEYYGLNHVTSVTWGIHSNFLGVGCREGAVSLWDGVKDTCIRKYYEHNERVGSMSLLNNLFLTGSKDKSILLRDIRLKSSVVQTYNVHKQEVCGLKWSPDGNYFASGGNDNKLCVFSPKASLPLMKKSHKAAVKAIAWSPRKTGLLASGAGTADKCIRLWNINTKQLIQKKETNSQVCNLVFSKHSDELISSHGFSNNDICIWDLKNFHKIKTLKGHTSRVLYLAMSPCGNNIVSGAGDETLRFWNLNYEETKKKDIRSRLGLRSKKCKKKSRRMKISKLEQKIVR
jgi:cell division cycle 20-like protein 1 (cofactor of APC complex)